METINPASVQELVMAVAATVGISVTVMSALIAWLGKLWLQRILNAENAAHAKRLEEVRHELSLSKSTYDRYLELILNYFTIFYEHYRLCQRATNADGHRAPDGSITKTKDDFFDGLDLYLVELKEQEGRLRLLLPSNILKIYEESFDAFNNFKGAMKKFKNTGDAREAKRVAFAEVNRVKSEMEAAIREFLRTENLLK